MLTQGHVSRPDADHHAHSAGIHPGRGRRVSGVSRSTVAKWWPPQGGRRMRGFVSSPRLPRHIRLAERVERRSAGCGRTWARDPHRIVELGMQPSTAYCVPQTGAHFVLARLDRTIRLRHSARSGTRSQGSSILTSRSWDRSSMAAVRGIRPRLRRAEVLAANDRAPGAAMTTSTSLWTTIAASRTRRRCRPEGHNRRRLPGPRDDGLCRGGHRRGGRPHGQRGLLPLSGVRCCRFAARGQAEADASLPPSDQWKGGGLQQDTAARVGVPAPLPLE